MQDEINASIERHRATLLEALTILEAKLPILEGQRDDALIAVIDSSLPATVKAAIVARAEKLLTQYHEVEGQIKQLLIGVDSLASKARSVVAILNDPNLDPTRSQEPAAFAAIRWALSLLVKKAVVSEGNTRSSFFVQLSVTTDPIGMLQNGPVVSLGNTRAHTSSDSRLILTDFITTKTKAGGH